MNGPMGNPMHSPGPMSGPGNRMNGMPVNPPQQSPHPQMGNMPPNNIMNNNMNIVNSSGGGPNMMSNSNRSNTPVSTNNNNNSSPTTSLPSGVPNLGNSNNLSGSNNNNGPNTTPSNSNVINSNTTNSSNMNQNNQMPHSQMVSGPPGMNNMNMGPGSGMAPMNNPGMMMGQMPGGGMYGGPKPMPVSAGKVYPADTPMVFNPQNPNAPPIYPCGVCHKEVHDNDQGLLCESGCNFWFHR